MVKSNCNHLPLIQLTAIILKRYNGYDFLFFFLGIPRDLNNVKKNNMIITECMKPLLSGHLRDLPKCPLNRGSPLNKGCKNCAMFVNDKHSTVTLCCDKVACC